MLEQPAKMQILICFHVVLLSCSCLCFSFSCRLYYISLI